MKNSLLSLLLLVSVPVFAQTTPYQAFEVDSVAEPRGGFTFFNTFIQATLRKPIPAQVAGLGGRTIVEGVVEPNGHISNVKAIQSFRPDCDQEAVRVFSLFNAWKPARKNGQAVRQRVAIPVTFEANEPFTYVIGTRITYFGADSKVTADSTQAKYKQIAPIDTNGVSTGDIVVYESKSKGWKEYYRLPLVRRKNSNLNNGEGVTYTVGNQNYKKDWHGDLFTVDEAGTIRQQAFYQDGKRSGIEFSYHANGSVAEKREHNYEKTAIMTWYANGQIKQIKAVGQPNSVAKDDPEVVTTYWDSTGHEHVTRGSGWATYRERVRSANDTTQYTFFAERGFYENGTKQGIWTGRHADGSYFYEETYNKGILLSGKSRSALADTLR